MELETIISIVTFIVALILGQVAKKYDLINRKLIPIQNICIGIIVALIEFFITKNFSTAILLSGLTAGGTYDAVNNIKKILEEPESKESEDTIEEVEYSEDDTNEE